MGGSTSTSSAPPATSSATITSSPTPITTSAVTSPPINTVATTATTPTSTSRVTSTPTPAITSTTTATRTPTPTASVRKVTPTPPVSTEGTVKPTFYAVAKSVIPETEKTTSTTSSAYARWYKWTKFEQQKRDKGKIPWYMGSPITTTDSISSTTTTLTMTTAKIGDGQNQESHTSTINAIPSFQLRSTAVYSPPHGDRILSGRSELIDTDTSNFKYYQPDNRPKQTVGNHTRATMYRMNTHLKQTPLPTPSSTLPTTTASDNTNTTGNSSSLPTFVSRGLQTDLEAQPINSSSTQMRYYEKQQPQVVPISSISNHDGFFHLASRDTTNQPVLPPIEKTPGYVEATTLPPPPPTSILKKPSTVLSQDRPNPLCGQTHDKVLEELRKRNKNTKDGTYRVKKIHLLEKSELEHQPSTVSFNLPPTKANQSISRSEKLFFSELLNRKK